MLPAPASAADIVVEGQTASPQLVSLVASSLTNKEIAAQLNLSESTVKNHIHRLLKQVDAESRYEAIENIRASGFTLVN